MKMIFSEMGDLLLELLLVILLVCLTFLFSYPSAAKENKENKVAVRKMELEKRLKTEEEKNKMATRRMELVKALKIEDGGRKKKRVQFAEDVAVKIIDHANDFESVVKLAFGNFPERKQFGRDSVVKESDVIADDCEGSVKKCDGVKEVKVKGGGGDGSESEGDGSKSEKTMLVDCLKALDDGDNKIKTDTDDAKISIPNPAEINREATVELVKTDTDDAKISIPNPGDIDTEETVMESVEDDTSVTDQKEIQSEEDAVEMVQNAAAADDDWEGVESSELEKVFAQAVNFVEGWGRGKGDQIPNLTNDVQMQLYGLHKLAVDGPCHEPQPMALMMRARAKWNAWQRLGSMSPEEAMEQYIKLLSDADPDWMQHSSHDDQKQDFIGSMSTGRPQTEKTLVEDIQVDTRDGDNGDGRDLEPEQKTVIDGVSTAEIFG